MELKSYEEMCVDGWQWTRNCSEDDTDEILTDLLFQASPYDYKVAMPHGTEMSSSESLRLNRMVGIYRRGGRAIGATLITAPAAPSSYDYPPEPEIIPMTPDYGSIGDRPREPAYSMVAVSGQSR
jgi:hypothetical protein